MDFVRVLAKTGWRIFSAKVCVNGVFSRKTTNFAENMGFYLLFFCKSTLNPKRLQDFLWYFAKSLHDIGVVCYILPSKETLLGVRAFLYGVFLRLKDFLYRL